VYNLAGSASIENSTISANTAIYGGGLSSTAGGCFYYSYYGYFCFFGSLVFTNSLIAGNQAAIAPEIENLDNSTVHSDNFNLFGANGDAGVTGFTAGPTDIVPAPGVAVADILAPLADNGGPTATHALVAGSPAIDAGNPGGCPDNSGALLLTDQRGFVRHVDGNNDGTVRCDIGAFEYGAEFIPPPAPTTLTANKAGNGSGAVISNPAGINCGGDCSENYDVDTVVTLTAAPAANSQFTGWSGGGCSGTGTCIVTMDANKLVTASFVPSIFTLTVTKSGNGTGTVTSNPAGIECGGDCSESYNFNTVVTVTPTADAGSVFSGWSGDADCSDGVVAMNADKSCTATFSKRLNVTAANGGETWHRGSKQTIRWTSSGLGSNVKIELSRDGGASWKTLFKKAANDGSQPWKVNKPATTQGRIRVCSLSSPSVCDTSDADFTIQ
jgi:hypothetical protein